MPRKSKSPNAEQPSVPEIPEEFLDQIVSGPMTAEAVEAVMHKFKKAVIERALGGEMTHRLGFAPGASSNQSRNSKRVRAAVSFNSTRCTFHPGLSHQNP
ncbi:MAG: putative transposase [Burkholderiales bacterium]|jgi:hypothetical protein